MNQKDVKDKNKSKVSKKHILKLSEFRNWISFLNFIIIQFTRRVFNK